MIEVAGWWRAAADVFLPRRCPVCAGVLEAGERHLCRRCLSDLPRTHFEDIDFNAMEQLFAGKVPIERAASYFYYQKTSPYAQILFDIKYRNMPRMARWLAARAAREMRHSGLFDGVQAIVPVPLHRSKLARRGYNQCDYLARGLADELGIPVRRLLVARRAHDSQTRRGATERWINAQGTYVLDTRLSAALGDAHFLLVDDVVTTGATLEACVRALRQIPDATVSVFTLATSRLD